MDQRIEDIFTSLLGNIETLDHTLMTMDRSELLFGDEKCLGLMEHIREACISTLQNVQSIERKVQGNAFVIPVHLQARLE
jgi:hypothetical protein